MYAAFGPGQMIDLDPFSPQGVDLVYGHEYVAHRTKDSKNDPRSLAERTNLYAYAINNPIKLLDPSGLYATPGYGHFCGPRNGEEWDGLSPLDCLDLACQWHDDCIGHKASAHK
jgi:hypothetical protein